MRRRAVFLLAALLLLPACGGDGPVVISDLAALTSYLVAVLEAESTLAQSAPAGAAASSVSQALEVARRQVEATEVFAAAVAALDPPPEAEEDQRVLLDLAADQTDLYERMIAAVDARDLAAITGLTREALGFMTRSADEAAGRQELVVAALAARPERPLNQYLTAIAGLWVPLNADYQRLAADAQRSLLAGNIAGAAEPYEEMSVRFNAFLPQWDAVPPPPEAAAFHAAYREWASEGIGIFDSLLPLLEEVEVARLQTALPSMLAWAAGVNDILVMRNTVTVEALLAP